jgi:hypothetical protein
VKLPLRRPSEARRWLVAWVVFASLGSLWALASPIFSVPDEPAHAIYAAAAVRGEIWEPADGTNTHVTVPADFATASAVPICYAFKPEVTAGCAPAFGGHTGMARTGTTAGRYPPAYYVYAGLPTLFLSGAKALYAMRFLTVLLVSALLASATCSALRMRRPKVALAGLGLAVTPMVLFFSGAVNPQGPEIAAAIAVWSSGYVLLAHLRTDPDMPLTWRNPLLRRTLLAMTTLSLMRSISLLWLAVIVGTLLATLLTRRSAARLARSRAVWSAFPVLLATCGSTLFWIVFRHALIGEGITAYAHSSLAAAFLQSTSKGNEELQEMIGVFGWLDAPSPGLVYVAYLLALGGMAALTLTVGGRRIAVVLGLVVAAVVWVPVTLELMTFREDAFPWQGRYTLPIAVGIPVLMAFTAATSERDLPVSSRRIGAAFASVFGLINLVSFMGALNRYIKGASGFFGVTPSGWAPPVLVVVLGSAMLLTVGACCAIALRVRADEPRYSAESLDDSSSVDDEDDRPGRSSLAMAAQRTGAQTSGIYGLRGPHADANAFLTPR